jgi:hypothetical protein
MAEGPAAKKQRVDAGAEDGPKLSAETAERVKGLQEALDNYLAMARAHASSHVDVGVVHVERARVGLESEFQLFDALFPECGVGWSIATKAKVVLDTLAKDPTGDTTARVASGERGVFTAYFSPHRWVRLVNE